MATVKEEIAKNLHFYRKKAGYTQKDLAALLGVKNTAVSNWESGANSIDIETLFAACELFGVTLNDMYGKYSEDTTSRLTDSEIELLTLYRALNEEGQSKVIEYVGDLNHALIYKNDHQSGVVSKEA